MAEGRVTIFGATGYTGRLCAREMQRAGLRLRLAGRRQEALATFAADLGGDVETAVADAAEPRTLRALTDTTDVLVSTAGPYEQLGRPVVDAALAGGAHYVDVSAEAGFLAWVHEQDGRAAEAGVALCPGFGVTGAPGELLAALAARELGGPARAVRVGYLTRGALPTAGTVRSAIGIAERGGLALRGGVLVAEPAFADAWTLPFPEPLGPRPGVSVPLPEVVSAGRSLGATEAHGYVAVPGLPGTLAAARLAGRAAPALARTSLWNAVRAAPDRLPEGPSERQRVAGKVAIVVEVRSDRGPARAWCRLTDVYGTTARLVAATARRLSQAGADPGARTPSQVVGDAGAFLEEIGARWERLPA